MPAPPKDPDQWTVLGDAVRTLRNEMEWSQDELARRAKITGAYVSHIETGKQENVGRDILVKLAMVFGLTVDELQADVRAEKLDPPLRELIEQGKIDPSYRERKKMVAAGKIILRPQQGRTAGDMDWFNLFRLIRSYHQ